MDCSPSAVTYIAATGYLVAFVKTEQPHVLGKPVPGKVNTLGYCAVLRAGCALAWTRTATNGSCATILLSPTIDSRIHWNVLSLSLFAVLVGFPRRRSAMLRHLPLPGGSQFRKSYIAVMAVVYDCS